MRLDLAGGTLDIWPLYLIIKDCVTVQLSCDFFSSTRLVPKNHSSKITIQIEWPSRQLDEKNIANSSHPSFFKNNIETEKSTWTFSSRDDLLKRQNKHLNLIASFVDYFKPSCGFDLYLHTNSPIGRGLGASSSMAVSLLKCFSSWLGKNYNFTESLFLCRDLEARSLKTLTGIQDYIVPLQEHSALNIIYLNPLQPKIRSLPFPKEILKKHLMVVDTGIAHDSGKNNWSIIHRALEDEKYLSLLLECRDVALEMAESCLKNRFEDWPYLFEKEYHIRKKMSQNSIPGYSFFDFIKMHRLRSFINIQNLKKNKKDDYPVLYINKKTEQIRAFILKNGGFVKVLGAGGGGSILIWANEKEKLKQACLNKKVPILNTFEK